MLAAAAPAFAIKKAKKVKDILDKKVPAASKTASRITIFTNKITKIDT